jgi:hypothetical protein
VSMAQMWTVISIMATAFAAIIGFSHRAMTEQGKTLGSKMDGLRGEINAQMDGLRSEFNGLRGEVRAQIDGLRGEMNARFDHLTTRVEKVESIEREVHTLSLKVMGREIPPEN